MLPKKFVRQVSNFHHAKDSELYTYSPPTVYTEDFYFAMLLYPPILFGLNVAFDVFCTFCAFGLFPMEQISECPVNAADFDTESVFYDDCVNTNSTWYKTYNMPFANTTFKTSGWFYWSSWSRETLKTDKGIETGGSPSVEAVYESPLFHPFWAKPVDYVGIILLIGSFAFLLRLVASSFLVKTSVYRDRVEVEYYGGEIQAVPLGAILDEDDSVKKHEWAECPPFSKRALQIKSKELVKYKSGHTTTTIVKKGDGKKKPEMKILRAEPDDVEEFNRILREAREGLDEDEKKKEHFFHSEIDGMKATSDDGEEGAIEFVPNAFEGRTKYWVVSFLLVVIGGILMDIGFKIFFYLLHKFVQPNRPQTADQFRNEVLAITPFTVFLYMSVLYYGLVGTLNAVPTKIEVGTKAIVVSMDRAMKKADIADEFKRICIPMDSIAAVHEGSDFTGSDGRFRRLFNESGFIVIRAKRFFIITETKKLRTIEKKVAEDQEGGVEVCEGYFNYFLLTSKDREEFLRYVKGRHAADPAP